MKKRGYITVNTLSKNHHKVDICFDNKIVTTLYGVPNGKIISVLNVINKIKADDSEKFKFLVISKINTCRPLRNIGDISDKIAVIYKPQPGFEYYIDKYTIEPPIHKWIKQYPNIECDIYNGKYAVDISLNKKTEIEKDFGFEIDKMFVTPLGRVYLSRK